MYATMWIGAAFAALATAFSCVSASRHTWQRTKLSAVVKLHRTLKVVSNNGTQYQCRGNSGLVRVERGSNHNADKTRDVSVIATAWDSSVMPYTTWQSTLDLTCVAATHRKRSIYTRTSGGAQQRKRSICRPRGTTSQRRGKGQHAPATAQDGLIKPIYAAMALSQQTCAMPAQHISLHSASGLQKQGYQRQLRRRQQCNEVIHISTGFIWGLAEAAEATAIAQHSFAKPESGSRSAELNWVMRACCACIGLWTAGGW